MTASKIHAQLQGVSSRDRAALNSLPQSVRLVFGPFSLRRQGASLYRHDQPVRLGSRALQLLVALIQRRGEVVSRSELMAQVWPETTVVENNLTVNITALRHALGDGREGAQYVVNVPGRGYRFVAPVTEEDDDLEASRLLPAGLEFPTNLPVRLRPVVGLAHAMAEVAAKLSMHSLVTVAGPAGVGKTTLVLNVARAEGLRFPDGVWLIDLASLREAEHVPAAVAATIRIELGPVESTTTLISALRRAKALLVLDNCEHVIDAIANLAAMIGQQCPDVVLLATSREPLRVGGEAVYALAPLGVPPESITLTASEALGYPAVELLVERTIAATNDFALRDEDASVAASICRRLDGLPLAIEFAAAHLGAFGLAGLAARLDHRFKLMQSDMRGVAARHRTLTTALDWSYDLLDAGEQAALRRLAVFAGGFTLEGAAAVIGIDDLGEAGGVLARLHAKSLIASDIAQRDVRFRLLETTRAYAMEKLEAAREGDEIRLRHAVYFSELFRQHRLLLGERDGSEDAPDLDNLRAALRFAMGPAGDTGVALSLASGGLPVWSDLSLAAECRARLREVLALLPPEQATSSEGWDLEISLRAADMLTTGVTAEAFAGWAAPAPGAVSAPHTRRPLVGDVLTRWFWCQRNAFADGMTAFSAQHLELVEERNEPYDQVVRAWIDGLNAFILGDLVASQSHLERFLEQETPRFRRIFMGRSGYDRTPLIRSRLGVTYCLRGDLDYGLREARAGVGDSQVTGKAGTVCEAKQWSHAAFEIAQIDPAEVEASLDELVETAGNHLKWTCLGMGLGFKGVLAARQGDDAQAEHLLRKGIERLDLCSAEETLPWFHGALGLAIARQGRVEEGLTVTSDWARRDRNPTGWCAAEFQRAMGCLLAMRGDVDQARATLIGALEIANAQGAMAWAQRIHSDLHRLGGSPP